jgi:hypothetical protein
MTTRMGFLVSSLGISQLSYHLLAEAHAHLGKMDFDLIVFYQDISRTWKIPSFCLMNITEAYSFDGVVIATDLSTAGQMARMPGPSDRLFYAWDLEWICDHAHSYERLASAYGNPDIPLIARSRSHAEMIRRCWNRDVEAVVEYCSLPGLLEVANGRRQGRGVLRAGVCPQREEHL